MFRNHPGGWNAARQAVFILLPFVIGAGVLNAGSDRPAPGMSRLEATQSSVAPLLERAAVEVEGTAPAPAAMGGGAGEAAEGPAAGPAVVDSTLPAEGPGPVDSTLAPPAPAVAGDVASPASADSPAAEGPAASVPDTTTSTSSSTTTSTTAPAPSGPARNAGAEAEVVPLTNADRAAAGLGSLSRNACLDAVASGYAEQMARSGVLAHNPGAGAAVTGCRTHATWGDNVGWSTACDTARLEREWMASPSHRRNILTGAFTLIGVGAWTDEAGECWVQVLFSN